MHDVQKIKDEIIATYLDIMRNAEDPGARLGAADKLAYAVREKEAMDHHSQHLGQIPMGQTIGRLL